MSGSSRGNAALFFHPDAYDTRGARLMGRHSAGESFLRGMLRYADVDRFFLWNAGRQSTDDVGALLNRIHPPPKPVTLIPARRRENLTEAGVLHIPAPNINHEAWRRRPYGSRAYALSGVTHTTASEAVMAILSDFLLAPLDDYDALICTSRAVRASVEAQLEGMRDHLAAEFGPRKRPEPQRVTIPLGVNTADFSTSEANRRRWREQLDIPEDAVVALYVGRFHAQAKMNPALMALALERAAKSTGKPIYWVNSGWAESEEEGRLFHEQTRALCPSIEYRVVDGRPVDVRFSIWSVADFFISFSDNIQETFGLTPVEAMAAGLPCVVSDWNGYRDTVRDKDDGFRIPTVAPGPGAGEDLAYWFANGWITYANYVGAASQYTQVDLRAAEQAISALVLDPDLRKRLGAQAQIQARQVFDWSVIIPQYQALWAEQDARRRAAAPEERRADNPFRPDPFTLFRSYPTRHLHSDCQIATTGMTWAAASAVLSSPLATYSHLNNMTMAEAETVLTWLSHRPAASIREALEIIPEGRRPYVRRAMLWLARFGVISIGPPA